MRHKYIPTFLKWTRLNENAEDFNQLEEEVKSLTDTLNQAIQNDNLTTRILMDWFNSMIDLYNSKQAKGYIAEEIGKTIKANLSLLKPFFTVRNTELTRQDITSIRQYKEIAGTESINTKKAEDRLRALGLID
jgi:hypothetical protein